jgi:hypothetical protein
LTGKHHWFPGENVVYGTFTFGLTGVKYLAVNVDGFGRVPGTGEGRDSHEIVGMFLDTRCCGCPHLLVYTAEQFNR